MEVGIFARTFSRPGLEKIFDAITSHRIKCLQFNFACAGLPTLPEKIEPDLVQTIRLGLQACGLSIAAVSGTCNLIHPDRKQRAEYLKRFPRLIEAARDLGSAVVTVCTGTLDPSDMWRPHRENSSAEAWGELLSSLDRILPIAEERAVILGIEPEPANVVSSAQGAAKLLREIRSPSLRIVFDAANLIEPHAPAQHRSVLSEAFDLLGSDIVLAHAKDLLAVSPQKAIPEYKTVAAGKGFIDYDFYVSNLRKAGFNGALVLHSLEESEVPAAVKFLRTKLDAKR